MQDLVLSCGFCGGCCALQVERGLRRLEVGSGWPDTAVAPSQEALGSLMVHLTLASSPCVAGSTRLLPKAEVLLGLAVVSQEGEGRVHPW